MNNKHKTSAYLQRNNIYIPVYHDTIVQELSDGTLIFYVDVRHLPESISKDRNTLRVFLAQFKKDIEDNGMS